MPNVTLPWFKNSKVIKINLASCLILSGLTRLCGDHPVAKGQVHPAWYEECPQKCPNGAPRGAELFTAQNTGVPNLTLRSAPWGAPQGDVLVHSGWENRVKMPSVLANTSTEHSQEYTLLFQKKKRIRDFAAPLGDTPKVTPRKSCLAPAETLIQRTRPY